MPAKQATKASEAAAQRRKWARHGRTTWVEYNKLPTAMPRWVQDEVVARWRAGASITAIIREASTIHRGLTEYHIKRILRVFWNDPVGFKIELRADIFAWVGTTRPGV